MAYTVGQDADGVFVVKIDTVDDPQPARAIYERLRGESNYVSPFAGILSAEDGLKLSFEELVDWSATAIAEFEISYDEVAKHIGLSIGELLLSTDPRETRAAFAEWRECVQAGSIEKGPLNWLPEGPIVFRKSRDLDAGREGLELGTDPGGRSWAVRINEPRVAGSEHSLSAFATDPYGKRYILRQGMLRPSPPQENTIPAAVFAAKSGLPPVQIQASAPSRVWFVVACLDEAPDDIRRSTSNFVQTCATVRSRLCVGEPDKLHSGASQFGSPEIGGTYVQGAKAATEQKVVVRRQGIVWLGLAELLSRTGTELVKGKHPSGYEVDGEIEVKADRPILLEIKTGIGAGDLHTGVGQLNLYRQLIPRLANHEPVLLLPRRPREEVANAIEGCGISIHTYDMDEGDPLKATVSFSPEFLARCGLTAP